MAGDHLDVADVVNRTGRDGESVCGVVPIVARISHRVRRNTNLVSGFDFDQVHFGTSGQFKCGVWRANLSMQGELSFGSSRMNCGKQEAFITTEFLRLRNVWSDDYATAD